MTTASRISPNCSKSNEGGTDRMKAAISSLEMDRCCRRLQIGLLVAGGLTNGRTKIRSGVGCQPPCSSMQPFSVLAPSLWKLQGATIDGTDEEEMLRREYMAAIKEM
ncbi:hypothetical protein L2E82_45004 [Cichorium intybus]|uniref:Uncharacterized protein n=1 Tax=Cichorium intybus TaxID=13427 RepID=A0ACB8ZRW6_CICIN|nr:hypothetical protein L2E82_45004 [Cichorium intybus]